MQRAPTLGFPDDQRGSTGPVVGSDAGRANVGFGSQSRTGMPDVGEMHFDIGDGKWRQVGARPEETLKIVRGVRYSLLHGYHDSGARSLMAVVKMQILTSPRETLLGLPSLSIPSRYFTVGPDEIGRQEGYLPAKVSSADQPRERRPVSRTFDRPELNERHCAGSEYGNNMPSTGTVHPIPTLVWHCRRASDRRR